jgi:hypothetical protein
MSSIQGNSNNSKEKKLIEWAKEMKRHFSRKDLAKSEIFYSACGQVKPVVASWKLKEERDSPEQKQ